MLKWALRLPLKLYHAGLGHLLGYRFMMLAHRGRKSGRIYETVLEVPYYSRRTGRSYVISGWSDKADWFRNILANQALWVVTGGRAYKPTYLVLSPEEVERFWRRFRRKHPVEEWLSLRLFSTPGTTGKTSSQRRAELVKKVRVVVFYPETGSGQV